MLLLRAGKTKPLMPKTLLLRHIGAGKLIAVDRSRRIDRRYFIAAGRAQLTIARDSKLASRA